MYPSSYKLVRTTFAKFLALNALILLICVSAHAQRRNNEGLTYGGGNGAGGTPGEGFGIAINAGYDIPSGDLGKTFKAAPTFGFSLVNNLGNLTLNASFGIVSFKPKIDTIYYYAANQTIGSLAWNDNKITEIYIGAAYNIQVDDGVKFFFGLNAGIYNDKISYHTTDIYEDTNFSKTIQELYLGPKFGFSFAVSNNFSIDPGLKLNYFKYLANKADNPYVYNSNKTLTLNIALAYVF